MLNSIFREAAEAFGVSVLWLQIGGWTLVLLPIVLIGMSLLRPLVFILSGVVRSLRWLATRTHGPERV